MGYIHPTQTTLLNKEMIEMDIVAKDKEKAGIKHGAVEMEIKGYEDCGTLWLHIEIPSERYVRVVRNKVTGNLIIKVYESEKAFKKYAAAWYKIHAEDKDLMEAVGVIERDYITRLELGVE